jgi:hypothetical protein
VTVCLRGSAADDTRDRLQHSVHIAQNVVVPETNNFEAVGREHRRACRVSTLFRRLHVLTAVQFDYETDLNACEIGEVLIDRMLPTESQAEETSSAKPRPQASLGVGGVAAERSSESAAGRWNAHRRRMRRRAAAG